jgi:hypothetical protein
MYSLASSFLLVPAAGTTGEVTALFETIHRLTGKLLFSLHNRQRNEAGSDPVSGVKVKSPAGPNVGKTIFISNDYADRATRPPEHSGWYPDIKINRLGSLVLMAQYLAERRRT